MPLQAIWPVVGHRHTPLVQLVPVGQALPHWPQFWVSCARSTHWLPHRTFPALHKHCPATQILLGSPQLAVVVHCTQLLVTVSQYGVAPEQVVLSVHCTHLWAGLHTVWPVPAQLVLLKHWTQKPAVVSQ